MLQHTLRIVILLVLFIASKAALAWGAPTSPYTEKELLRFFPEARKDGVCYLFRLGECEIIAATNTYGGGEVDMLFVHGAKQNKAKEVAEKLKTELFTSAQIRPFEGKEPWVALIPPRSGYDRNTASRIIGHIIDKEDPESPLRFSEWRGKQLRVWIDHSYAASYFSTSYSSGRKSNGTIELSLDITQPRPQYSEFRIVNGKLTQQEMAIFITRAMGGTYNPTQSMSKKELTSLQKSFPNANIVSYNSESDLCIVSSKKTYYYGTIDAVRSSLRRQQPELASFEFPQQESMMPDKRREMLAAEQASTNKRGDQVPSSSQTGEKSVSPLNFQDASSKYISTLDKI